MCKRMLLALTMGTLLLGGQVAAEGGSNKSMIAPGLYSFTVQHDDEPIEVMRNQDPESRVHELYSSTRRGMPQPIHPFKPHPVETLGEREFTDYMMKAQNDDTIMIVDTRTEGWHYRLTIPGSVNMPYTLMDDPETISDTLEEFGAEKNASGGYEYGAAKTLVMFCNGYWCGQTPSMVRALLKADYPAEKIKYYRGGMQAWTSLGLTVVGDAAE